MSAILKDTSPALKLPALTSDLEQGKRDMDEYGLCVHRDFITPDEVQRLKDRLIEQAEQECEYGVALLSGSGRSSGTWYGHPEPGHEPGWQGIPALYNKGREFIDLLSHPL